jgi:hypothetical protein
MPESPNPSKTTTIYHYQRPVFDRLCAIARACLNVSNSASRVLPPDSRHPDNAWPINCRLLHKACERLLSHGLPTGALTMLLAYRT